METVILNPTRHWECAACGRQHVTKDARPITPLHGCTKMKGLSVPYVQVVKGQALKKNSVRVVLNEREDYIGKENVQTLDGRPIMNLITERADGSNDIRVYAPMAKASME